MDTRFKNYLEKKNQLSIIQYVSYTEDAVLRVSEYMYEMLENRQRVLEALIDLS